MVAAEWMEFTAMNMKNETHQILSDWLGDAQQLAQSLARAGFLQEEADRLFPDMHGDFSAGENIRRLLAVFLELGNMLLRDHIRATPMLVFNLKQVRAINPLRQQIYLSRDVDNFHPPLIYVLPNEWHTLLPMGAECRAPMEFSFPAGMKGASTCILVASPSERNIDHSNEQDWDIDIRLIGTACSGSTLRDYNPAYAGHVDI